MTTAAAHAPQKKIGRPITRTSSLLRGVQALLTEGRIKDAQAELADVTKRVRSAERKATAAKASR